MLPEGRRYDKGATAMPYRANGHFTGRPEQWLGQSAIDSDNVLNWLPNGWSRECATALGWFPDAMWWRAEDAVVDPDEPIVHSVPDHAGGGHDLVAVVGDEPIGVTDDGDGFPAVGMYGFTIPFGHVRLAVMAVTSPPELAYFTCYVVAHQFLGTARTVPGISLKGHAGAGIHGTPQMGPTLWGVDQVVSSLRRPMPLLEGRHLWRVRADGETLRLAIDGCESVRAGYSLRTPVSALAILYTGALDLLPDVGGTVIASRFDWYEIVYLPYPVDDTEDAAWVRFLCDKYTIQREECDMLPIGTVIPYAGPNNPPGYLECDGSAISRATYFLLWGAIGTTWGAGDGSTTFNLPDMRGRTPRGVGTGPGLATVGLGDQGGAEAISLAVGQLPSHGHAVTDPGHGHAVFDPGHNHTPDNGADFWTDGAVNSFPAGSGGQPAEARLTTSAGFTGIVVNDAATGITVNNTGSGNPVPTLPPFRGLRFLINAGG